MVRTPSATPHHRPVPHLRQARPNRRLAHSYLDEVRPPRRQAEPIRMGWRQVLRQAPELLALVLILVAVALWMVIGSAPAAVGA